MDLSLFPTIRDLPPFRVSEACILRTYEQAAIHANPLEAFRDYQTDGMPSSGVHHVDPYAMRLWSNRLGVNLFHDQGKGISRAEVRAACLEWMHLLKHRMSFGDRVLCTGAPRVAYGSEFILLGVLDGISAEVVDRHSKRWSIPIASIYPITAGGRYVRAEQEYTSRIGHPEPGEASSSPDSADGGNAGADAGKAAAGGSPGATGGDFGGDSGDENTGAAGRYIWLDSPEDEPRRGGPKRVRANPSAGWQEALDRAVDWASVPDEKEVRIRVHADGSIQYIDPPDEGQSIEPSPVPRWAISLTEWLWSGGTAEEASDFLRRIGLTDL